MHCRKTAGELQHEYLQKLLTSQRTMINNSIVKDEIDPNVTNVSRGNYLMNIMNMYRAGMLINSKG